jgi:hypothetical protein
MFNQAEPAFAPTFYLFQANAAALSLRIREPEDFIHTEGSACLTAIGGAASSEARGVDLNGGALKADHYRTEVTGDYVDRKAAARLTESHRDTVSGWRNNTLEITTSSECTVNQLHSTNFNREDREAGKTLAIGQLDFKMEGRHRRRYHDELEIRFARLSFSEVFINGKALRVHVVPDLFDSLPTFSAFQKEYNASAAFRKEFGHMIYRTSPDILSWLKGDELHDRRGFATVTVVNKVEWADPKDADPKIVINGHSVIVPGYGTIYLGEMTIAPAQRRLHMVRVALGCRFGGEMLSAMGCPGGHEHP